MNVLVIYSVPLPIDDRQMSKDQHSHVGTRDAAKGMVCEGCGGRVRQLTERDSGRLLRGFLDGHTASIRAFECVPCEAIIYSDELINGRFVPPQFRAAAHAGRADEVQEEYYVPERTTAVVVAFSKRGLK